MNIELTQLFTNFVLFLFPGVGRFLCAYHFATLSRLTFTALIWVIERSIHDIGFMPPHTSAIALCPYGDFAVGNVLNCINWCSTFLTINTDNIEGTWFNIINTWDTFIVTLTICKSLSLIFWHTSDTYALFSWLVYVISQNYTSHLMHIENLIETYLCECPIAVWL